MRKIGFISITLFLLLFSKNMNGQELEKATLAGGCFWCIESIFSQLQGVINVKSGYGGGTIKNPTYKEVCTGQTGHAEVVQITYDSNKIGFEELLEVFWTVHDPTTLNRQGADIGTQYRSAIFYHNEKQKQITEDYIKQLESSKTFKNPIVTEVTAFSNFYPAEDYHTDYYERNGEQPYCQMVIRPKVLKFQKTFNNKLKK